MYEAALGIAITKISIGIYLRCVQLYMIQNCHKHMACYTEIAAC